MTISRLIALFSFCLITAALISMTASAQNTDGPIGTILEVEGTAQISHNGAVSAAAIDMPVYMRDIIETDAESRAFILFMDDTELTLGEKARLTVDEYVYDPDDNSKNKGRFSILRGAFLFTSGLIGKKDSPDVKVETNYGSIGIRGTVFWGGEINDEYGVLVQDGGVVVETKRGRINVNKGQGTSIRSRNSVPSRVKTWPQEKVGKAVKMIALKRQNTVRQRIQAHKERRKTIKQNLKNKIEKRGDITPDQKRKVKKKVKDRKKKRRQQ